MNLSKKIALIVTLGVLFAVLWSNFLLTYLNDFKIIILIIFAVLPVSLSLWAILVKILVEPLKSFNDVAKVIAIGNLGQRVKVWSQDEIGELAQNINAMIKTLAMAFQSMADSLRDERAKEKELVISLSDLQKQKAKDEALLTSIGDGVFAIDSQQKIILFNKSAAKLTGLSIQEALNKPYQSVLRIVNEKDDTPADDFIGQAMSKIKDDKSKHIAIITKEGKKIPVSYSTGLIYDPQEHVIGMVVSLRDITFERELDKIKDEFLSIASHELRTPMSAIKSLISMIFEGDFGQVNQNLKDPLTDIGTSTERLIALVNDMLDVSRIEAGRLIITLIDTSLEELVKEVTREVTPLVLERGLQIITGDIVPQKVRIDPNKTKEILSNLIGNSIKFTDFGTITISSKRWGNFVYLSVTDTGIGIAEVDQAKLFSKFSQISDNMMNRPQGTGLGLYISREFARKMGGELWIEQSGLGKGSTFTVSLPNVVS